MAQSVNVASRQIATAQGTVNTPVFSPDGQTAFYLDETGGGTTTELYSVSVNGGTPTVLNTSLVAGGNIHDFEITPDGQQIVYRADQITDNVFELFIMPITGGTATRLNPALSGSDDVANFVISSDSAHVVYEQNGSFREVEKLFVVQLSNGQVTNLTTDLPSAFTRIVDFIIDPNNQRLVFTTFSSGFSRNGVLSVQLDGTGLAQLSINISGDDSISRDFFITPDGTHVIYGLSSINSAFIEQLFIVPIDGSEIAMAITERSSFDNAFLDLSLTPDGQFIIAQSEQLSVNGTGEIIKIPVLSGQAIERLSQTFVSRSNGADNPLISPDGRFVVYQADNEARLFDNLFQVPIEGGTPIQLNPLGSENEVLSNFAITPDSQSVVYVKEVDGSASQLQLFATSITGGEQSVLSGALTNDDDDEDLEFSISDDSQQIVFSTLDFEAIFLSSLSPQLQEESCFVIPAKNNKYATICL